MQASPGRGPCLRTVSTSLVPLNYFSRMQRRFGAMLADLLSLDIRRLWRGLYAWAPSPRACRERVMKRDWQSEAGKGSLTKTRLRVTPAIWKIRYVAVKAKVCVLSRYRCLPLQRGHELFDTEDLA